jgi:RNA-directed DNA polymerase
MTSKRTLTRALSLAFLAGPWEVPAMTARGYEIVGVAWPAIPRLARLAARVFRIPPSGRAEQLRAVLLRSRTLSQAMWQKPPIRVQRWLLPEPTMARAVAPLATLNMPRLLTPHDVADFVQLPHDELDWFADLKRLNRASREQRLRHYQYRWVAKRSGAYRLIEAPKQRLKRAQRHILDGILGLVPLHSSCNGHRRGYSVRNFAAAHVGKEVVIALDLSDFFATVTEARVRGLFAALGYADEIAALLAALCCTPTPNDVLNTQPRSFLPDGHELERLFFARQRLRSSHLPQGAPTSPALANLAAYRLDTRLAGLAGSFDASYTRYADDLAFSGGEKLRKAAQAFVPIVGAIAIEEGFALRFHKTRVMVASQRQQLCGVVVNETPTLPRRELERLEATLVNCVRHGPSGQNRVGATDFKAYLRGRVAWADHLNPSRGAYLRELFARIAW